MGQRVNLSSKFELPKDNPLRLVSYLKKYSRYFWIQTAGGIIYNTVIVAGPILLGKMLDIAGHLEKDGVTPAMVRSLLLLVLGFVLVTVFFQYGRYIKRWYLRVMTNRIASDMRAGLLSRVLQYPMADVERESVGDLMSRTVGDVDQITNTLQQTINEDRKSTRLNSSHDQISYAVFCLKKKKRPPIAAIIP